VLLASCQRTISRSLLAFHDLKEDLKSSLNLRIKEDLFGPGTRLPLHAVRQHGGEEDARSLASIVSANCHWPHLSFAPAQRC